MTDTLVSVIVRTMDRKALLREALASVLAQSHPSLEIIVVNDGGEDVTEVLPETDARRSVVYLDLRPGPGRSAAANAGLEAAGGRYLIFLDDDDWFEPGHIANLLAALRKAPEAIAAYSAVRTVRADGTRGADFAWPWDRGRLLLENFIPIHAVLFSRHVVDAGCRFDTRFDRLEDWDFWLQASRLGDFVFTPECTASYRIAEESGFGARTGLDDDGHRLALFSKWRPLWNETELLEILDRARQFPRQEHLQNENRELQGSLKVREEQLTQMGDALLEARDHAARLALDVEDLHAQAQHWHAQVVALRNELDIIYGSRSWRVTAPLRRITRALAIHREEGTRAMLRRAWRKLSLKPQRLPELHSTHGIAQSWQPLAFEPPGQPLVSIVIPVYNKHLYTFHCLRSLLPTLDGIACEVIVVDDRSQDETAEMLAAMTGLRVLRNEENQGFIRSCNAGARLARGEFLVLLNNDTEPKAGWLQALLATFREMPDAGMAGARLVYPDGKLQEAGGIVWQDGSAWNYGRGDDPNRPEYAYCREADYCSGACLMLRKQDFEAAGMFDEHYLPAYYEDTDLAFQIRAMGKKVYYQPMATIVHFEGVTSGTDTGSGIKQYQVSNQRKFLERWRETLRHHRPHGSLPRLEKERPVKRRVLVIDARILMPDHDSGSLRMFSLLRIFQTFGYKVSFIADNLQYHERYTPMLQALGIECVYHPYVKSVDDHLMQQGHLYDLVLLSRADVAGAHIAEVKRRCPRAKILFDTVDLHFLREQRQAELANDPALVEAAVVRKHQELGIARQSDMTLVVSPAEVELFHREAPDVPLALLSNIHRVDPTEKPFGERRDMLFIANFEHPPNIDAVDWFLDAVFPLVLAKRPGMRLKVVGGNAPRKLRNRAGENVEFTGFVADIRPLFNDIRLSVAPLRYGAGVKGKINSSMAFGVPVVATTVAVEGMGLEDERDVLVADSPGDFAEAILRVHDDEALWLSLAEAGKRNIEKYFSVEVAERQLRAVLERMGVLPEVRQDTPEAPEGLLCQGIDSAPGR